MTIFYILPQEIESYIMWLSCGPNNLDTYIKKKNINMEIKLFEMFKRENINIGGVYLQPIPSYEQVPELEDTEYLFSSRWLLSDYGISKDQHHKLFLQFK